MKLLLLAVLTAALPDHTLLESSSDENTAAHNIQTNHRLLPAQSAPRSPVNEEPAEIVVDVFARYSDAIRHTTETGEVVPVILYREGNHDDEAIVRGHLKLIAASGVNTQAPFFLHDVTANDARSRTLTDFFEEWSESDRLPRLSTLWREIDEDASGRAHTSVTGGGDLGLPATVDQFADFIARQSRRNRSSFRQRSVIRQRVVQPRPVIERTRQRSRSSRRTLRLNRIEAPRIEQKRSTERRLESSEDLPCSAADGRASSRYTEKSSMGISSRSYYYTNRRRGVLGLLRGRR